MKIQGKLNKRHTKWVEFLGQFSYVIKHKQGKANVVVDALSRRYALISMLETKMFGFNHIKYLYSQDHDFSKFLELCEKRSHQGFFRHEGYLFKNNILCLPQSFLCELMICEAHKRGLMGHFGIEKTLNILLEHFFWPKMKHDVIKFYSNCIVS